jgi:hypothetical protein
MNNAINTVTTMFDRKKEARKEQFKQQVLNIPYFPMYQQHRGRPPLDPRIIIDIQRQLHAAEIRLKQGIDQDWKSCVLRYPEVLTHYYNQVQMQIPSQPSAPFQQALAGGGQPRPPSIVNHPHPPPPQSTIGMSVPRSATVPPKQKNRERRSSKVNLDGTGADSNDVMALLGQRLEGLQNLGRAAPGGRTKAATPAPQASTPAPLRSVTARPGNKRRESRQGFQPPPPPPPPPSAPHAPNYDQLRNSFLGSLGSLGNMGR